ncbi:AgmX/PglI C-terminal domain-containing protein [Aurantivibrio plasticivorans]
MTDDELKESSVVWLTLAGGVIGGLVGVINAWSVIQNLGLFSGAFWWDIVILPSLKGAVAAFLGVFLFSPGKPEDKVKTCAFAIACGLAFQTILESGAALGENVGKQAAKAHAKSIEKRLLSNIDNGEQMTPEKVSQSLNNIAKAADVYSPEQADAFRQLQLHVEALKQNDGEGVYISEKDLGRIADNVSRFSNSSFSALDTMNSLFDDDTKETVLVATSTNSKDTTAGLTSLSSALASLRDGNISVEGNSGGVLGVDRTAVTSGIAASDVSNDNSVGPRTDEEIRMVFDRNNAALYQLYSRELREYPTLQGTLVLKITVDPDGSVSAVKIESSELDSPQLEARVVSRVKGFNFGAKEGASAVTIIYPMKFLPNLVMNN